MNNTKVSAGFGISLLVIIAVTVGIFVWNYERQQKEMGTLNLSVPKNQKQPNQISNNNPTHTAQSPNQVVPINLSDPFQYSKDAGFYGTLILTGYLDMKQRVCKQGEMCQKTVTYASFIITATNNENIYTFLAENKGNSYASDNSVGLGCYEKEAKRIYSTNSGDDGTFENSILGSDLQKLLQSNKNNTINLQLVKPSFMGGGDAPECYSHFRLFKIIP
jgi:hypothetical protein